ncbi:hypothetical protein [Agrilutibacter niabensis]|uniref:hypothetical protein n=1 Tax=Agrilutibacter niabensis TaxID=380628 RepID=UPI003D2F7BD9
MEPNDGAKRPSDGAKRSSHGALRLNDRAQRLNDGAQRLNDRAKRLNDRAKRLNDGAQRPNDGAQGLGEPPGSTMELQRSNALAPSSGLAAGNCRRRRIAQAFAIQKKTAAMRFSCWVRPW